MTVVGNTAGYTSGQMSAFQKGLEANGIAMVESRQGLIQMASAHMDLSKAQELSRIAQNAAVIGQMNSSQAFQQMITGIQRGEVEILKTMGLNVDFARSQDLLAAKLNKSVNDLTQTEKVQANLNAVMEKGKDISGAYEAAMDTAGKQLSSMQRYIDNLKVTAGSVFNDILIVAVQAFTGGLKGANAEAEKLQREGQLKNWGKDMVMAVAVIADGLMIAYHAVNTLTITGVAMFTQLYYGATALGKALVGDFSGAKESFDSLISTGSAWGDLVGKQWENSTKFQDSAKKMYSDRENEANKLAKIEKDAALEKGRMATGAANQAETDAAQMELIIKKHRSEWGKIVISQQESTGEYIKAAQAAIALEKTTDNYKTMVNASKTSKEAQAALDAQAILDANKLLDAKRKELDFENQHTQTVLELKAAKLAAYGVSSQEITLMQKRETLNLAEKKMQDQITTEKNPKIKAQLEEQLAIQQSINYQIKEQSDNQLKLIQNNQTLSTVQQAIKMYEALGKDTTALKNTETQLAYETRRLQLKEQYNSAIAAERNVDASITSEMQNQLDTAYALGSASNAQMNALRNVLGLEQNITREKKNQAALGSQSNPYSPSDGSMTGVTFGDWRLQGTGQNGTITASDYDKSFGGAMAASMTVYDRARSQDLQDRYKAQQAALQAAEDEKKRLAAEETAAAQRIVDQQNAEKAAQAAERAAQEAAAAQKALADAERAAAEAAAAQALATKNATITLNNSLDVRELVLKGMDDEAKALQLRIDQATELAKAQADGVDTARLVIVQTQEYNKLLHQQTLATAIRETQTFFDTIKTAISSLVSSGNSLVSSLTSAAASLRQASGDLSGGAQSNLSPEQKYELSRQTLASTTQQAMANGDATLYAKIPALVTAFLEQSKAYNASNTQYGSDFSWSKDILDAAAFGAADAATHAQKVINAAQKQQETLDAIKAALTTDNTAALPKLYAELSSDSGTLASAVQETTQSLSDTGAIATRFTTSFANDSPLVKANGKISVSIDGNTGAISYIPTAINGVNSSVSGIPPTINGVNSSVSGIPPAINGVNSSVSGIPPAINGVAVPFNSGGSFTSALTGAFGSGGTTTGAITNGLVGTGSVKEALTAGNDSSVTGWLATVTTAAGSTTTQILSLYDMLYNKNWNPTINVALPNITVASPTVNVTVSGSTTTSSASGGIATTTGSTSTTSASTANTVNPNTRYELTGYSSYSSSAGGYFLIQVDHQTGVSKQNIVVTRVPDWSRIGQTSATPFFARGGLAARGWAVVGEEGPELVNFSDPGRVYSAPDTRAMLSRADNYGSGGEIAELKAEIIELKKAIVGKLTDIESPLRRVASR